MRSKFFAVALLLMFLVTVSQSAGPPTPIDAMTGAARAFLDTLAPDQKARVRFAFDDDNRFNWHYIPSEGAIRHDRRGLPLKAMDEAQRSAALELLRVGLSQKGYSKAEAVRALEDVLVELGGDPKVRDKQLYFFTIFGQPAAKATWAWRYEGHHLSQHWTVVRGAALASTPQFFGANPAEVRDGKSKGLRVLAAEEDMAYQLLQLLDTEQRQAAIIATEAPNDILTTNTREAAIQEDRGVSYAQLTTAQQALLIKLIEEHASAQPDATMSERMTKIKSAGFAQIKFAWMGGIERDQKHYYRLQGPTFLIEFDNTQNNGNHAHSVWRDFKGDWGRDLLGEHYRTAAHSH
ncbi:MAG: DUF3500 domain-containing protein [Candidatus Obscuribacterales bacterium]|nr:DUF3500 domain-containing protein [Steroidobacteraceae bacterium]